MFWFTILAAATTTALVGATDVAPCEKSIIQQLTNYYENSRFQFSFDYCENLGDGRGFTAGVAGFTTGTHDALEVIKAYVEKMDGEPTEFDGMLDRLKEISREKEGLNSDVAGLSGYCRAWETASNNPVFRQAQMEALDANAWTPSQAMADKLGLNLTITRGFLYDGWIMQGSGDDPDSMEAIIKRAAKAVEKATSLDGIPSKGRDEIEFLKSMFRQRFRVFTNPTDSATKDEWTAAVGRLYSYFFLFCTGQDTFTDAVDALDFDYKLLNVTCDTSIEDRFVPVAKDSESGKRNLEKRAKKKDTAKIEKSLATWLKSEDNDSTKFCQDVKSLAKGNLAPRKSSAGAKLPTKSKKTQTRRTRKAGRRTKAAEASPTNSESL